MAYEKDIDDATLARLATQGDRAAFEILISRYRCRLWSVAFRMLKDPAEAEDVVQEVAMTVWRKLPQLTHPEAVRTWIFRVAYRQCLVLLRQRRERSTIPTATLPDMETLGADLRSDPQRIIEACEGMHALSAALTELPQPQQIVWLLAEREGLAYAEIARTTGSTEQAVRGRLFRARTTLAKRMAAWR